MKTFQGVDLLRLKEKFIATRIGGSEYFTRADISDWLARQEVADEPDMEVWESLVHLADETVFDGFFDRKGLMLEDILRNIAFPLGVCALFSIEGHVHFTETLNWYVSAVGGREREMFLTPSKLLIRNPDGVVVVIPGTGKGGVCTDSFLESDVVSSALLSWMILEECARKRKARAYVCGWLAQCIDHVRTQAEKEFDGAVGVSEDGSRIIHVDWVFMIRPNGTCSITKNEFFRDRKLLRPTRLVRFNNPIHITSGVVPYHVKGILSTLAERSLWDVRSGSSGEKQVLFYVAFDGYNAHLEKCLLCQIGNDE